MPLPKLRPFRARPRWDVVKLHALDHHEGHGLSHVRSVGPLIWGFAGHLRPRLGRGDGGRRDYVAQLDRGRGHAARGPASRRPEEPVRSRVDRGPLRRACWPHSSLAGRAMPLRALGRSDLRWSDLTDALTIDPDAHRDDRGGVGRQPFRWSPPIGIIRHLL
jgi:hypothetical protein